MQSLGQPVFRGRSTNEAFDVHGAVKLLSGMTYPNIGLEISAPNAARRESVQPQIAS